MDVQTLANSHLHPPYESKNMLNKYLLFHFGRKEDLLPFSFGPQHSLHFPSRCVTECLDIALLPKQAKALDIGCAVGRSSFELSRYCESVLGLDTSSVFIAAAKELQQRHQVNYDIIDEGSQKAERIAEIPEDVFPEKVDFRCADVMSLAEHPQLFDVVLAANVLCRLPNPSAFLQLLPRIVSKNGQLILISPYSWLEEYTPRKNWLGGNKKTKMIDVLKASLKNDFELMNHFDLPFLIREHVRKYEWGISEATLWKRIS